MADSNNRRNNSNDLVSSLPPSSSSLPFAVRASPVVTLARTGTLDRESDEGVSSSTSSSVNFPVNFPVNIPMNFSMNFPFKRSRSFDYWTLRESFNQYVPLLFRNRRLTKDDVTYFPRDSRRFEETIRWSEIMANYWTNSLSSLVRLGPYFQRVSDTSDVIVDKLLVPLLHYSLGDALRDSSAYIRQNIRSRDQLLKRARLLVEDLDSIYSSATDFCLVAGKFVRLQSETDELRMSLEAERYSQRVQLLREENERLRALVLRAETLYENTLARYRSRFQREIDERERVIEVLTNYLSGTLFRVGSNPNYIEPRYDVNIRGTSLQRRIEHLLPLYRRLRRVLLEMNLLRPLVVNLVANVRGNEATLAENPLLAKYF